ncbi:MAG: hypothetical protein IMZ64_02850 [Bacteroidetes bacterium]|nr:hypothetical protein [Bacteroidota bacterium]
MKNAVRISRVILVILLIFLIHSCEEKPTAPVITTTAATAISNTTATSGGEVTNEGGASVTARGVCWNTSLDPTIANNKTTDGTGAGSFTSSITGLAPGTTYYVRAYATNSVGTAYGNQITIEALAYLPTITTTSLSAITATSAISGGTITSDGGAPITAKGVCWSTSQNPTIASFKTDNGTGTDTFTSSITGLTAGVTYYVRAYATNRAGTNYGNQLIANGLTADINNLVPQSIIDELKRLGMPINTGVTPPTLNGIYNITQFVLKSSNIVNDWAIGSRFNDWHVKFSLQDNSRLTLRVDYASIDYTSGTATSTGYGVASFIVGTGNTFTVFVKVLDTRSSGETADLVYVLSGNVGANSINNFYYANFMLDNHGYTSVYMANSNGRVLYDLDGVSEKITSLKGAQMVTKGNSVILPDPNGKKNSE